MKIEEEVMELKGKLRVAELRIQALVNMLTKEGVLTKEEVDSELNSLLEVKEDEDK